MLDYPGPGFRPVVCLKSGVKLQANASGSYDLIRPDVVVVEKQAKLEVTVGESNNSFDSLFTVTTTDGGTATKTYTLNGATASAATNTSTLAVGTYTLICTATYNGVTDTAYTTVVVKSAEPDFSGVTFYETGDMVAGQIKVKDVPDGWTPYYATVLSGGDLNSATKNAMEGGNGIWIAYTGYIELEVADFRIYFKNDVTGNFATTTREFLNVEIRCFVAGTKVLTPKGLRNIEELKRGDKIYSMNMENMQIEEDIILQTYKNIVNSNTCIISVGEEHIESTLLHPYYEKTKGWISAEKLEVGDILIDGDSNEKVVLDVKIKEYTEPITVYNFSIQKNQNYFVGTEKILVHNFCIEMCFVAGTKVSTPEGYKNIEDIQIGDIVYSMNLQTMEVKEKVVERLKITENAIRLTYLISTGECCIESTQDHKFYVKDRGWTDACELKVGDILLDEKGNDKPITDIQTKTYEEPITVYNFEVEDNRNYFVGEDNILVYTIPDN